MKKIVLALILCMALVFCVSCSDKNEPAQTETTADAQTQTDAPTDEAEAKTEEAKEDSYMVTISVKDYGDMTFELYPEEAPITVENFVELAKSGFYEGLVFHRISKGFMIQGGASDGRSGGEKTIKGEFAANGVNNSISHKRGVISMARTTVPDSASTQFFICDADSEFLDGNYAAFGMMTEGFDVLDAIASTEVTYGPGGELSQPLVAPVIDKVTVE